MEIPHRRLVTSIALAVLVTVVLSVRLSHPVLHADETTYLSTTVESMVQGTVLPVKGNGDPFFNKPPLALWLMRLSCEIPGPSPFAARLPSVLAAAGTASVLYLFGAAVFGEGVGIVAALIFALTPGLLVLHGLRSATPDALEILLVTSAIVGLEGWRRRRRPWMLACLVVAVAASAWVKSPFALAVWGVYLLATELPAHRAGRGTPRFGVTIALVAGAWLGAWLLWLGTLSAAASPHSVTRELLVNQYMRRLEGHLVKSHVQGPGFYLASTIQDFGPLLLLSVGAVAAGLMAMAARRGRPSLSSQDAACLVVWSLVAPALATLSASKLPWYAYLSYPGVALLVAASAQAIADRTSVRAALLTMTVLVLVWRIPAAHVWPAEAEHRGPAGRLWEMARRGQVAVVPGPRFQAPHIGGRASREDWLFLRMLLAEGPRSSVGPCRATLVNRRRDVTMPGEVLELYRPTRKGGAGLYVVAEGCGGPLREQLLR